ncbi:argininosuccinate synthase [Bradymonas sediminis]|uniref:Argininosuccinate synthase n=1 Tax=Bradymonas sediminis TaxID=1548548 RepID=A0A2Z4FPJ7_9DELT|nr:argininosuccinate synthase [Bradymonas sediminis]AWV90919.1 argininosuccinate synthase [Bradymonas sediminis]TDP75344.1 argininosuccinate synthase [Bradymonas sediminis]
MSEVILAFSGGLDTSFCVPWLIEKGYEVVTVFVNTGGVDADELKFIEDRAYELGAKEHILTEVGPEIWEEVVVPMVQGGQLYQGQYPLLCSDRYLIVRKCLEIADERGANIFAHGCTGMGNDQVRFDLTVRALGDYEIIAPIREIQRDVANVRDYELEFLKERGFGVRPKTTTYTINENLLGVTTSGSEVDNWQIPGDETYKLTAHPSEWPAEPIQVALTFEKGVLVALDSERLSGPEMLDALNKKLGKYGVGRAMYTGDTTIGLKGRIVFEAPGLVAILAAHRALEEAVLTRLQNRFKSGIADKWVELVYEGFFYDPLKADLEAFLASSQRKVNGTVTLQTHGGRVDAVKVDSPHILRRAGAVYAQSADWGVEEAEGFIKLFGQSSTLWAEVNNFDEN